MRGVHLPPPSSLSFVVRSRTRSFPTMSEDISVRNVIKLDGTNYQAWKFQVRALLVANGVFEIVTGDTPRPAQNVANEVHKKWIKDDARARVILSTTIVDTQLLCLLTCTTSKEMWDTLTSVHEQKSATNKLILTQRFHAYKMATTDSVM